MIFIHEGNPGAGKSYDVQSRILDQLKAGRVVYSNIDGHNDRKCRMAISEITGLSKTDLDKQLIYLDDSQLPEFWKHCADGSFIVLDEIHKFFNARDWSTERNRAFADWCSTHRHQGYDLCMITQRQNKIDGQARSMTEWRYFYRKLNFFGSMFKKGYLVYCYSGDDAKPLSVKKCSYDARIFKCYHSYKGNAIEKKVVTNANILRHPAFYALALVVVVTGYFFSQSTFIDGDVLGVAKAKQKIENASATLKGGTTQPAEAVPDAQAKAVGGEVQPVGLAMTSERQTVVLPVNMYAKKADGEQFVYVGRYRLPSWLWLSPDQHFVKVYVDEMPPAVLASVQAVRPSEI